MRIDADKNSFAFLTLGEPLPEIDVLKPFRCILISGEETPNGYKEKLCFRLVRTGCLYFMAWGIECEEWHDRLDDVSIETDKFVMTTWHQNDSIEDVVHFSKHCALANEGVELPNLLVVNVGTGYSEGMFKKLYEAA